MTAANTCKEMSIDNCQTYLEIVVLAANDDVKCAACNNGYVLSTDMKTCTSGTVNNCA